MHVFRYVLAALARVFLSSVFLASGIKKIFYFNEAEKRFFLILGDWQTYTAASEGMQSFFSALVLWSSWILLAAAVLELLGGVFLLLGIRERLGASLLCLVLVPSTVLLHHFWFGEGSARELQTDLFLKNIAILGGLLAVALQGTGGRLSFSDEEYSHMQ